MSKKHKARKLNQSNTQARTLEFNIEKIESQADAIDNSNHIKIPLKTAVEATENIDLLDDTEFNELTAAIDAVPAFNNTHRADYEVQAEIAREQSVNEIKEIRSVIEEQDKTPTHELVIKRLQKLNVPYYSNSNISEYISDDEREQLVDEAAEAYAKYMRCLIIDIENDPHARNTPHRVAKMHLNEIMAGRYNKPPKMTTFPNVTPEGKMGFGGLMVVQSEIHSLCAHHHQTVSGIAYIGVLPSEGNLLGLSKYTRFVRDYLATRPNTQEILCEEISAGLREVMGVTSIAVMLIAKHGCCSERGCRTHLSDTITTSLTGLFETDSTLRDEWHRNVMYQKMNGKAI